MDISLNWLRKYVDLPNDAPALSAALTSLGLEVEGVRDLGGEAKGVVVGEVLECGRHPDADKLSLCRVSDGSATFPVVCGAPNVAKGQKVLFAKVGADLPGGPGNPGMKIKPAKIRGQESQGMLCAEDEVGLGESHAGILVLDPAVPAGTPMQEVPGLCDVIFTLNVTPNRPDALNHLGVARELAAKLGKPLRYPGEELREGREDIGSLVSLSVEDGKGCTLYVGRVIRGVQVGPSPDWLARALRSLGKKSINNVVDLGNFVLFETGQPTHAFDLDKIRGRSVVVREGRDGEKLVTLDGEERGIGPKDMVIADAQGPMVLAGVMGGRNSEVDAGTVNIFLEAARFDPAVVRRQARRHGLSTDSSYRFERGVDPFNVEWVCDYLAALIARWCAAPGTAPAVARGKVKAVSPSHPAAPRVVALRPARAERLLGAAVPASEVARRLESIGLKRKGSQTVHGDDALAFEIPGFRGDLEREADLIEEVARLGDYNNIPVRPPSLPLDYRALPPSESLGRKLRHFLRDIGLNETLTLRFTSRKALAKLDLGAEDPRREFVALRNPLSEDWEILPTTLLPSLLQSVLHNQNNQERDCRFFEVGKAFFQRHRERNPRVPGVREEDMLYLVLSGDWERNWAGTAEPVSYFHLKGILENVFARIFLPVAWTYPSSEPFLHPAESGDLHVTVDSATDGLTVLGRPAGQGTVKIGSFGLLHPRTLGRFDLKGPVVVAELSLAGMLAARKAERKFSPFGHFSAVTRDVNLVVDEGVRHADILSRLEPARLPHLRELRLNSVYRGQGVPEGKKALHYSFVYQHPEKTLTDEEVNKMQEKLSGELAKDSAIQIK